MRAAFELFGARGFLATTVEDITQAADVAKGTFFNYFPTKERLLTEMGEHRVDILRAALAEARENRKSIRDQLHNLLWNLMEEPGRSRGMARCMLLGPLSEEPIVSVAETAITRGRHVLSEMMALGQRRGEIRRDWSSVELALLFQQAFYGALYLWALHPNLKMSRSLERTFAQFWAGAKPREDTPRKRHHEVVS